MGHEAQDKRGEGYGARGEGSAACGGLYERTAISKLLGSLYLFLMLVGLLSDTHDDLNATVAGLRVLRGAGVEYFLHGGDVGGQRILDLFAGDPFAFVWGNNDWDRRDLSRYAFSIGLRCMDEFGEITLAGKVFAMTHGDDSQLVKRILSQQRHDYLITGHTHVKKDERVGRVRWINPGALHRARTKTVAVLDLAKDDLKFLAVEI
jgi:uncharacterized protein